MIFRWFLLYHKKIINIIYRGRVYVLEVEKLRFYEPQRHNAADAAHKGVHKKYK